MPPSPTLSLIQQLEAGQLLSRANAEAVMEELLSGRMETDESVRFLRALNARPVLVSELAGFASVMRRHAAEVFADGEARPENMIDTCGTGGDGFDAFNISTAAAIVAAGGGGRGAKDGSRRGRWRRGVGGGVESEGVGDGGAVAAR